MSARIVNANVRALPYCYQYYYEQYERLHRRFRDKRSGIIIILLLSLLFRRVLHRYRIAGGKRERAALLATEIFPRTFAQRCLTYYYRMYVETQETAAATVNVLESCLFYICFLPISFPLILREIGIVMRQDFDITSKNHNIRTNSCRPTTKVITRCMRYIIS